MCPIAFCKFRFDNAILCSHGLDDLTAADVNTDVSLMPNRKARNVRHGVDGSGLRGAVVHLVCTDIRHPMGTVVDGHRFRGQPAVALDEPYAVGGYIQAVYPYEEAVVLICNEEGKLDGLPLNRALRDEDGDIYDIVAGNFFLAGIGEDDFIDLPDELVEQFAEQFRQPEVFVNVGGRIIAYPVAEEPVQDGMSY